MSTKLPAGYKLHKVCYGIQHAFEEHSKIEDKNSYYLISPEGTAINPQQDEFGKNVILQKGDWVLAKKINYDTRDYLSLVEAVRIYFVCMEEHRNCDIKHYNDCEYINLCDIETRLQEHSYTLDEIGSNYWSVRWEE